jgi:hypothetical protein
MRDSMANVSENAFTGVSHAWSASALVVSGKDAFMVAKAAS